MRRAGILVGCLLVLLLAGSARTATVNGPQIVQFQSGGETVRSVLYRPRGHGPFPAVIVIHEWWGLNDWVKQQARDLAEQGYVTLAVDLYRGHVTADEETAHELMRGLSQDRAVRYLTSATQYLERQPFVDAKRLGAEGWCMGGGFAMQFAIAEPQLRAVVINYGALETDPNQLKKIHAAILGNFGARDRGITPDDVRAFAAEMQRIGHPVDVKEYPDAGHAFENPASGSGYRPQDTADAEARTTAFFARTLKR